MWGGGRRGGGYAGRRVMRVGGEEGDEEGR